MKYAFHKNIPCDSKLTKYIYKNNLLFNKQTERQIVYQKRVFFYENNFRYKIINFYLQVTIKRARKLCSCKTSVLSCL